MLLNPFEIELLLDNFPVFGVDAVDGFVKLLYRLYTACKLLITLLAFYAAALMFGVVLVHYFKEFIFVINVNSEFELLSMVLFIIKFFNVLLLDGEPGNIPDYEAHS